MSKSNAAISGKARAMYAHRLTAADWEALLNCSSVPEVAAYLKSNTFYGDVLSGIADNNVHRGDLENLLHERLIQETVRLGRYDIGIGEPTAFYLIERMEIDWLLHAVIRIQSKDAGQLAAPNPYLASHAHIDPRTIDSARTYQQLLDAVKGTHYYKLMLPFCTESGDISDYTGLEHALQTDLYSRLYQVIDQKTKGEERAALRSLFDQMIDLMNYSWLIRLKSYYHVEGEHLQACLLPFGSIPQATLQEMVQAETPQQVTAIFERTRVGKRLRRLPYKSADDLAVCARYQQCHRNLFFSSDANVVMFSYIFLMENEFSGLIHLIEGLRYQVPKAEIKRLLSPYHFE